MNCEVNTANNGNKRLYKGKYLLLFFVAAVACCLSTSQVYATSLYFNNFNDSNNSKLQIGSVGSEWSSTVSSVPVDTVPNPNSTYQGGFLGQFGGNDSLTLSLSGSTIGLVNLSFDTYFIRSWDGSDTKWGPDYFKVQVSDGPTLLYNTFSNGNPAGQSYVGNGVKMQYQNSSNSSMTGSLQQYSLGYNFYDGTNGGTNYSMDSLYHFDFSFINDLNSLNIQFAGIGLQGNLVTGTDGLSLGYLDESWGIDNVSVDVTPVPEPSSLWLISAGGIGLLAWCRRNRSRKSRN